MKMHDMKKYKAEDKTRPRRESHNTKPKMARVGVKNMASYMRGVTPVVTMRPLGPLWPKHTELDFIGR